MASSLLQHRCQQPNFSRLTTQLHRERDTNIKSFSGLLLLQKQRIPQDKLSTRMLNIALVAVVLLLVLLLHKWYRRPADLPPGPRGLPVVGILPFMSQYPERDFAAWSKKYGPLISVPMGLETWVILNDYDIIMETLVKRSDEFHERPYVRYLSMLTSNGIVFAIGGKNWTSHRKFGVSALRSFGGTKGVMEKKIVEEVRYLTERLANVEGRPFQIQSIITNAVANVICNIALGKRGDYEDDRFQKLIAALLEQFHINGQWKTNVIMAVPFLCDVPPFSWHVEESMRSLQTIRDMIDEFLEEHKSAYDPNDIRDIMDAYLQTFQHQKQEFIHKYCQDFFVDLFVAGTETTASTLRWGFLCLMLHEDVQERMHEEIDRVIGKDGTPSHSHREDMPYTCAVIHEILRLKTLVPLSLPRCASNDVTVRGYRIPKGTNVLTNLWNVHNDDTYWTDPENFSPQRHLDEDGNFTNSRHVMSFGAGARVCLGEQLARTELWIFLVSIIQKFRLSVDPNSPDKPSLDRGSNALVYVPNAYDMVVTSR